MAYHAARVETEGYCRWPRLHEIVEFARRTGVQRLGVAYCPDMSREAGLAAGYFRALSFKVLLAEPGAGCEPRAQAWQLAAAGTDLNVLAGLCVGHDALFIRASSAPVTSLVSRDLRLQHNPVAALYARRSYLREVLRPRQGEDRPGSFVGGGDAVLDAAAREVRRRHPGRRSRLEEAMDFARGVGARHLGIAFCVGLRCEAWELSLVLESHGFLVSSICCKAGAVPKERLGILDAEKVRPGGPEMICNPLAQAALLNRQRVDLVLLVGQCVGHDSATMMALEAPVIYLVTKDRVLAHNSVAALYELGASHGKPGGGSSARARPRC